MIFNGLPWKQTEIILSFLRLRQRGVTPRPRSGAAAESARLQCTGMAERSYSASEVGGGGREELPRDRGQGW